MFEVYKKTLKSGHVTVFPQRFMYEKWSVV